MNPRGASDVLRSFFFGPARSIVPALFNLAVISLAVAKGGFHAAGIWATLNLVAGLFLLVDFGISQYVTRSLLHGTLNPASARLVLERTYSLWCLVGLVAAMCLLVLAAPILAFHGIAKRIDSVLFLCAVPAIGLLALVCGNLSTLHIAANRVHFAQVNQILGSAVQLLVAGVLLQVVHPYQALVSAVAGGYAVRAIGLHANLRRSRFEALPRALASPGIRQVVKLICQTKGFALLGAAQQAFHLVNRGAILGFGGTAMLGAFEIASRIPFLLEQAFSNGLQPLFSLFSTLKLTEREDRKEIARLSLWIYRGLVVLSIGALAAWITIAGPFIGAWLDVEDKDLVRASQILAILNAMRALAVPSFWVLQAKGSEGSVGLVYALQAMATLLALTILGLLSMLTVLTAAFTIAGIGIAAEITVVLISELRLGYLSALRTSKSEFRLLFAAIGLVGAAFFLAAPSTTRADAIASGWSHSIGYGLLWLACSWIVTGGKLGQLFRYPSEPASS